MKRKKKSPKAQSIVGTATSTASLGAVLSVRNIAKACEFYQEILGFQLQFTLPRTDGELRLAVLKAGTSTLLLGRLDELHYEHETRARLIRKGPHGLGITLTLLVPDVDKIYAAARKARAEILLSPPTSFMETGFSCSSIPTVMSGKSRKPSGS